MVYSSFLATHTTNREQTLGPTNRGLPNDNLFFRISLFPDGNRNQIYFPVIYPFNYPTSFPPRTLPWYSPTTASSRRHVTGPQLIDQYNLLLSPGFCGALNEEMVSVPIGIEQKIDLRCQPNENGHLGNSEKPEPSTW